MTQIVDHATKVQSFSPLLSVYLAVHATQATLLDDEVTGGLQEVGPEVALLDVVILIPTVSGPGAGPDRWMEGQMDRRTDR